MLVKRLWRTGLLNGGRLRVPLSSLKGLAKCLKGERIQVDGLLIGLLLVKAAAIINRQILYTLDRVIRLQRVGLASHLQDVVLAILLGLLG